MHLRSLHTALASLTLALTLGIAAGATAGKPSIKTVVNAIKYEKDDLAAQQVAFGPMTERIMGSAWKDVGDSDRKELIAGVETLIRKISFRRGREQFKYLDAILYKPVRTEGDEIRCLATVVIHHELRKTEMPIDFVFAQEASSWKIVDVVMSGESTTSGIHQEQIQPLLKEGGVPAVMKALRGKLAEVS
jgi:phospholipid transport system substrate-binding protein